MSMYTLSEKVKVVFKVDQLHKLGVLDATQDTTFFLKAIAFQDTTAKGYIVLTNIVTNRVEFALQLNYLPTKQIETSDTMENVLLDLVSSAQRVQTALPYFEVLARLSPVINGFYSITTTFELPEYVENLVYTFGTVDYAEMTELDFTLEELNELGGRELSEEVYGKTVLLENVEVYTKTTHKEESPEVDFCFTLTILSAGVAKEATLKLETLYFGERVEDSAIETALCIEDMFTESEALPITFTALLVCICESALVTNTILDLN